MNEDEVLCGSFLPDQYSELLRLARDEGFLTLKDFLAVRILHLLSPAASDECETKGWLQ